MVQTTADGSLGKAVGLIPPDGQEQVSVKEDAHNVHKK